MVTRSLYTYALSRLNKKSHQAMAFFVSDCHFVFFKSFKRIRVPVHDLSADKFQKLV